MLRRGSTGSINGDLDSNGDRAERWRVLLPLGGNGGGVSGCNMMGGTLPEDLFGGNGGGGGIDAAAMVAEEVDEAGINTAIFLGSNSDGDGGGGWVVIELGVEGNDWGDGLETGDVAGESACPPLSCSTAVCLCHIGRG